MIFEKNIPIPLCDNRCLGENKNLILSMNLGDSFVCVGLEKRNSFLKVARRLKFIKLTSRKIDDNKYRIWRIE